MCAPRHFTATLDKLQARRVSDNGRAGGNRNVRSSPFRSGSLRAGSSRFKYCSCGGQSQCSLLAISQRQPESRLVAFQILFSCGGQSQCSLLAISQRQLESRLVAFQILFMRGAVDARSSPIRSGSRREKLRLVAFQILAVLRAGGNSNVPSSLIGSDSLAMAQARRVWYTVCAEVKIPSPPISSVFSATRPGSHLSGDLATYDSELVAFEIVHCWDAGTGNKCGGHDAPRDGKTTALIASSSRSKSCTAGTQAREISAGGTTLLAMARRRHCKLVAFEIVCALLGRRHGK